MALFALTHTHLSRPSVPLPHLNNRSYANIALPAPGKKIGYVCVLKFIIIQFSYYFYFAQI